MADATSDDIVRKIQTPGFGRTQPVVTTLSDPIADTPMVVTLDELWTYDSNPRVTRNPKYDEIKASIRERGLDAPPPITRRPDGSKYIIRNGGNTRLSILRELWSETKDERFFRIPCLFRPWPERGEITLLTGHLCENDLHGALTFIERALAVEKARLLYEADAGGTAISQSELARRLTADGYPITQSQISRMQDTVRHVLPAIPTVLYGGLGRDQIERITALRKAAARVHAQHAASEQGQSDYSELFQGVLSQFDGAPESFNLQRVRDELVGQLSAALSVDYDTLALEVVDAETSPSPSAHEPLFHVKPSSTVPNATGEKLPAETPAQNTPRRPTHSPASPSSESGRQPSAIRGATANSESDTAQTLRRNGIDSTERAIRSTPERPEVTDRVQAIRKLVADATRAPAHDAHSHAGDPASVAASLGSPPEIWHIESSIDTFDQLQVQVSQLAIEIASECGGSANVQMVEDGLGFVCSLPSPPTGGSIRARATLMLLGAISYRFLASAVRTPIDDVRLGQYLAALLMGEKPGHRLADLRLSDMSLVKFFRLIRLGRRLLELHGRTDEPSEETADPS